MWTFDRRGDTWLACEDDGCRPEQLYLPGCEPVVPDFPTESEVEPGGAGGVGTHVGGEARTTNHQDNEPPAGWLSSMWLGGSYHAER